MRLENWSLACAEEGGLVLPEDFKSGEYCIIGEIYDRPGWEDGRCIKTSNIMEFTESKAVTRSGSIYELGTINKDYQRFINACKDGVTVLKWWNIGSHGLSGFVFDKGIYDLLDARKVVVGKVVSQDFENNICEISTDEGSCKVFVDWLSIRKLHLHSMRIFWTKEQIDSLQEFANKYIKPDLLGIHKDVY